MVEKCKLIIIKSPRGILDLTNFGNFRGVTRGVVTLGIDRVINNENKVE